MTELDLMTEHGQALIDLAKATGTWQVVSDAHSPVIPLTRGGISAAAG